MQENSLSTLKPALAKKELETSSLQEKEINHCYFPNKNMEGSGQFFSETADDGFIDLLPACCPDSSVV